MSGSMLYLGLLAADDSLRNFEFDWPATPARWAVTIAALVALIVVAVGVYRIDTRGLARGWRVLLTALRLAVIAGLLVIAFNPQERIRQMAFRPSRVAVLADVSLSMRFPEKTATASTSPAGQRNRAPMRCELSWLIHLFWRNCKNTTTFAFTRLIRSWPLLRPSFFRPRQNGRRRPQDLM